MGKSYTSENKILFIVTHWNSMVTEKYQYLGKNINMNSFFEYLMNLSYGFDSTYFHKILVEFMDHAEVSQSLVNEYHRIISDKLWGHKTSTIGPLGLIQPWDYIVVFLGTMLVTLIGSSCLIN